MSVIVRGMEMPESCADCIFLKHDSLSNEKYPYQCSVTLALKKNIHKRPKWCPLFEVKAQEEI